MNRFSPEYNNSLTEKKKKYFFNGTSKQQVASVTFHINIDMVFRDLLGKPL